MDVLLTHGYFINEDAVEQKIMRPYPPLGLLYVSAYLKKHDFEVSVFDSTFSDYQLLQEYILAHQPKIIAIYANLMTKINVIKIMKWVKSQPELEHIKIVLGGPDVTFNAKNYLLAGAHYIAIGEGEETMLELSKNITQNKDVTHISGIAYLENGELITTSARQKIKNIDELPEPDRAAIDLSKYLSVWKKHHGTNTLNISTQRGCPYTCKWCSTAVYGQSYRRRSATLVTDEIEGLIATYNPDSLWFVDDVFTVNHRWLGELHQEFTTRKINIPFEIITRAERLNDTVLQQLKEMGCAKIWIGAESGSQRIIDEMDRRVDINLVRDMILKTKTFGIATGTFIMVGYPTETFADIQKSVVYLKAAKPDNFTITIAYPIKGTGLYDQISSKIITQLNWQTSTDRDIDFTRTYSRKYYDYAVRYIVNEVNYHKETNPAKAVKLKAKSVVARLLMTLSK